MRIELARATDLKAIHLAYGHVRTRQHARGTVVWPPFTDASILAEIDREQLFAVWDSQHLAGVFSLHGFRLISRKRLPDDPRLSSHYHGIELALLEAPTPT